MFELTRLAKNVIITFIFLIVYWYLGLLANSFINFVVLTLLCLYAANAQAQDDIPNRMDGVAAGAIGGALKEPSGARPLTQAIMSVALFADDGPPREYLEDLARNFLHYRRCSCRVEKKSPWWNSAWVDSGIVDMWEMIEDETLDEESAGKTLMERVEEIGNLDWEMGKPAWKIHLVRTANNGSALTVRVAHWIGDGLRLVQVFSEMITDSEGNPVSPPSVGTGSKKSKSASALRRKKKSLPLWQKLLNIPLDVKYILDSSDPSKSDTPSPFRKGLTFPNKHSLFTLREPIPFSHIRAIKDRLHCSVNDVLTAAFAGSLRKFIEKARPNFFQTERDPKCRALLPVAAKSAMAFEHQKDWMHNNFGFLSCKFPIHLLDFEARCRFVQADVDQIKNSFRAAMGIIFPALFSRLGADSFLRKSALDGWGSHSLIFSNVPGWDFECFMGGHAVQSVFASFNNCIPQVILMSYNGQISGTLTVDREKVDGDPQEILDGFAQEIEDAFQKLG